jgi:methylated-DNA-[protein]-cysteine S-methyltransferase
MISTQHASPIGPLTLVSDGAALAALAFERHAKAIPAVRAARPGADRVLREAAIQLDDFFAGRRTRFDLPLAPRGTPFQARVWRLLQDLDFGETRSYGELASRLGAPRAVRAVAGAIGRNPISIIIPCHRILGARGALTGYAGGVARKSFLLALERRAQAAA